MVHRLPRHPVANTGLLDGFRHVGSGAKTAVALWACEPFRTADGRLWIGVTASSLKGIDFVRFDVSGLGTTTVYEPSFHSDRNMSAYWVSIAPDAVGGSKIGVSVVVQPKGLFATLETGPLNV